MWITNLIRGLVSQCVACATEWVDYLSDKTFTFGLIATCSDSFCCIRIWTYGSTPMLILCFWFLLSHSAFAFTLRISALDSFCRDSCRCRLRNWLFLSSTEQGQRVFQKHCQWRWLFVDIFFISRLDKFTYFTGIVGK